MLRAAASIPKRRFVDSIVVGGGPAGLAVVGNILDQRPNHRQLWVDPAFKAGRVGARYREVPSNTKVGLFLDFATAVAPFRTILDNAREPNAATALRQLPQDKGCHLGYAADMCLMLTEGVSRHFDNVDQHHGSVTAASFDPRTNLWTATLDGKHHVTTPQLVLCTGSSPITTPLPFMKTAGQNLKMLHLDTALTPSQLAKELNPEADNTIAVVGASHSAILVLMNLYSLGASTHQGLNIKWFTRHNDLRYAEYKDGWILYDNTGLKGAAAQWARDNLEDFSAGPVPKYITKHLTPTAQEDRIYQAELPSCTHVVQAIGYQRNPLPQLTLAGKDDSRAEPLHVAYDDLTGRFTNSKAQGKTYIPGLFGAGIAFPERVTDPAGNVEHAVGFWKFMRFLKKSVPEWVDSTKTL